MTTDFSSSMMNIRINFAKKDSLMFHFMKAFLMPSYQQRIMFHLHLNSSTHFLIS